MKITCPACSANYKIPDEKVQGKNKVFKIGCKRCGAEIRVRGIATSDDIGRTTLPFQMEMPEAAGAPQRVWFAGIDGKQVGPLTEGEVQEHLEAGRLKPDDLVWRKGFGAWTPVREVAPFQDRLVQGDAPAEPVIDVAQEAAEPASAAEGGRRKSPRRAQTLELSAAMIELLVKLDAQGGKSDAKAVEEPPALPAEGEAPPLPSSAIGADDDGDLPPLPAVADDEPPAIPQTHTAAAGTKAAAERAAADKAAAERAAADKAAADKAAADKAAADKAAADKAATDKAAAGAASIIVGKRGATKVSLPGQTPATAARTDDAAATKVDAVPVASAGDAAKAAVAGAATTSAAALKGGAAAKPLPGRPEAKATGVAAAASVPAKGAAPAKAKGDGPGAGLWIGIVAALGLAAGGVWYVKDKQAKEAARIEAVRVEAERVEAARLESVRVATAKAEQERIAREKAEQERIAAEKAAAARAEAERQQAAAAAAAAAAAEGVPGDGDKARPAVAKADGGRQASKAEAPKAGGDKAEPAAVVAKAEPAPATKPAGSGSMDKIDEILARQKAQRDSAAKPPEPPKAEPKVQPAPEPKAGEPDDIDKLLARKKAQQATKPLEPKAEPVAPSEGSGGAKLTQAQVDKVAIGARGDVLRCYMTHADVDGAQETIKIELYIAATGSVANAKIKGKYAAGEVGACIVGAVKRLHFPQGSGATQKYVVRYAVGG